MLGHLHESHVIYRDLKPENLMINERGYLQLGDFGMSRITHSRTYTFCGTADYMAPEMVSREGHSKSVDFWGLGILIYEMLTGSTPFNCEDPYTQY